MPQTSTEDHYARAAIRHHDDAIYLHDDGRLPNADHHFGFAVECALKSVILRYTQVSMNPTKPGKPPSVKPWAPDAAGKPQHFGHLPGLWSDVALLLHGRGGSILSGVLAASEPFDTWAVEDRYLDGAAVADPEVRSRRAAAQQILSLHQQALIAGVLT
ncbi:MULTISPECIES: hypothetical protein [Streptomyces]|uniref:Uncharacterized protein n=1 Tax=Streptomyces celluloflavus TaxID=58344 RepID=A0ABW7RPM7_9ACTN|nr:hypothetical protein [Streptomyces sp. SID7805]MYU53636.1 hypothetical protein [Streptomyces sp. SID7805]WSK11487.1 hypothetical protein OG717_06715 [Streptomyces celluloflavus]